MCHDASYKNAFLTILTPENMSVDNIFFPFLADNLSAQGTHWKLDDLPGRSSTGRSSNFQSIIISMPENSSNIDGGRSAIMCGLLSSIFYTLTVNHDLPL